MSEEIREREGIEKIWLPVPLFVFSSDSGERRASSGEVEWMAVDWTRMPPRYACITNEAKRRRRRTKFRP